MEQSTVSLYLRNGIFQQLILLSRCFIHHTFTLIRIHWKLTSLTILFMSTIIGVFKNRAKAEVAINELKENDIADSDISCVYRDLDGDVKDSQTGEKMGSGAVTGAATGAVLGTIAGLAVANGILPGIGTLFVAGPIATALGFTGAAATAVAGAATGAAAGGLIGALSKLGVSKEDAALYEKHVEKGEALVIAKTETEKRDVIDLFRQMGAQEIRRYA